MVKVIHRGLVPPDDPVYNEGYTTILIPNWKDFFGTPMPNTTPTLSGRAQAAAMPKLKKHHFRCVQELNAP